MIHFNASDGTRIAHRDTGEGRLRLAGLTRNASISTTSPRISMGSG